jgi:hypothetical protein
MPVKINELIVQTRIATSDASNTGGADMRSRMLIHQEKKKRGETHALSIFSMCKRNG